ncbi:ATP-NAD kinase family protein [Candidatus Bathycorpusculum sp.]|uniref:ATP-NAD kinase family protein n=1 Tax=Candidatus Bathycorpusculum sp. TaxID=2994959 RepID=UPI00282F29E4|nr:ATP-NAD kinase family protein [Candidatus Termitimicrobium sp.]MCL2431973.1 ATP-NAD kinase family protein [Candidatus Termitimicrobium sp.]
MIPESSPRKTLGFIINPVAGMGGAVGLKGTDGRQTLERAIALGAKPIAAERAKTFLNALLSVRPHLKMLVGVADMGEDEVKKLGYVCSVIGETKTETTSEDTQAVATAVVEAGVDLLVYCGGDGTTRDIQKAVGMKLPVLGVPTGVKMHSALFATSPQAAARVVIEYLWRGLPVQEAEVMDIDEQVFREGHLSAKLYGYMLSPFEPHLIQGNKMESPLTENEVENQAAIALYVIEAMQQSILYVVGPGTTTRTVADLLDQKKTLLGVDLFLNKQIVAQDVNEKQILKQINANPTAKILITPIGGQGFIFGRGNQQISPQVIRQVGINNIIVIATKNKLAQLNHLRVDTGDTELDNQLRRSGLRVIVDYKTTQHMSIE